MSKIDEIVSAFEEEQKAFRKKMEGVMKEAFKGFFDANPGIKSIQWTQFTPYFNDGDECVFSVNTMEYSTDGENFTEGFDYVVDTNGRYNRTDLPYRQEFEEFTKEINRIPDEVYKGVFGDHVRVVATRDGFDIDEYEHE